MRRNILAILALLGLNGCTTVEDPFLDGMTGSMPVSTGNRELPVHLASASLTGLGETPIGLRQTSTGEETTQILVWANTTTLPGENTLTISTGAPARSTLRKGPDRTEIARTLRSEFPGVAMSIDPVIRRNAYGFYGSATGNLGDNGGCVYAWQIIPRDVEPGRNHPAEVSLRYCHQAIGPEVLADLLNGLSLRGPMTAATAVAYGYPGLAATAKEADQPTTVASETAEVLPKSSTPAAGDGEQDFKDGTKVRIPTP